MIARSPSSALAIIKELRARGPFTHKVLGATILMDAVVIVIFAAAVSIAAVLVEGASFDVGLMIYVVFEILLDIGLGILVGLLLHVIMQLPYDMPRRLLILLLGLGVFWLSTVLHDFHLFSVPVGLFSEPLLICMTAGFYVTNFSRFSADFRHTAKRWRRPCSCSSSPWSASNSNSRSSRALDGRPDSLRRAHGRDLCRHLCRQSRRPRS